MGIFDRYYRKKENSSETKKSKSKLRVNSDDLEDINDLSYFKGDLFTGVYYKKWINGNLFFETEMLNGKDHGICKLYKGDGSIFTVINYTDGKVHDEDKKKESEFGEYMEIELRSQMEEFNVNREGLIKEYHEERGRIFSEGIYIDNKKQGVFKYYFDDDSGNLHSEITFKDDVENGLQKYYWENGKIRREGNVIDGKENGDWKIYDENGDYLNPRIAIIAKSGSGKSWVIRDIMYYMRNIPCGTVVAPTDKMNGFYNDFVKPSFIHHEYQEDIIPRLLRVCE